MTVTSCSNYGEKVRVTRARAAGWLMLVAVVLGAPRVAAAPYSKWGPVLLGTRTRQPLPAREPTPSVEAYVGLLGAGETPTVRHQLQLALGGGRGGVSGTFASDTSVGRLLWSSAPDTGLVLRGGMELFVDSLASLRVTRFSIPKVELAYARYRADDTMDIALSAGPLLLSRMRIGDELERFPIALEIGPRLAFSYHFVGAQLVGGALPLTSVDGGPALWSSARLCLSPSWLAGCAEAVIARIEPSSGRAVSFGYVGVSFGFNFAEVWESDELP